MAQTIKLKRSSVSGNTPSTSDLSLGEIGINTYDGKIFIKKDDGSASIVEVGGSSGTVTETFKTIAVSGQTSVVADSATDTLTFVAGTNMSITTSAGGDSVTFASTGSSGSATFIGLSDSPSNFSGAAGKYLKVNSAANALEYDTLTFSDIGSTPTSLSGYGITDSLQIGTSSTTALAGNTSIPTALTDLSVSDGSNGQVLKTDGSGNFSFTNQTGGSAFSTIAVSGQTSVVADSGSDTLTLVAGNNVTLSTNAGGDSITIASTADGGSGVIGQFLYTATAGQTAFSGNDDNSDSLVYVIGAVQVFLNGILLDPDTDYTATNGVLLTLVSAAAANDLVQLFSFNKKIGDSNVTVNSYSGNGSTTGFTLSINPGDETNTRVYVDGVYQSKSNYSVSGTTLTFSTAPPSGTTIEVESGNRSVTIPTTENLDFPDNVKLRLGTSQDLEIYHNSSDSLINDNGTGSLKLQTGGSTKLEVTSTGVDVTGSIVVSGTVDGIDIAARDGVLTSTTTTAGAALPKAGGAMTGAITTNSTFDGRDVATDGTKLDGIETSATADQTQSEINALGITATGLSGTPAISVANITTTGELRGPASLVIDPAGVGDNTGTVVIKGNLQVDGSQTTINSTTLTVDDLNLTLASGAANGNAANGAGLTIDGASATLTYASAGDNWAFNKNLAVTGAITSSGNVSIGSTVSIVGSGSSLFPSLKVNNNGYLGSASVTDALQFQTSGDLRAKTKLGIGIDPVEILDVKSASGDARIRLDAPSGSDTEIKFFNAGAAQYTIGHDDGTDNFVIGAANVDTPLVSVKKSGNVGIGTTNPTAKLHVDAPGTTAVSLTGGAAAGQIFTNEDFEFAFGLHSSAPYPLYIQGRTASSSSTTARDIVLNPLGGKVGIGDTSPDNKLDVNFSITGEGSQEGGIKIQNAHGVANDIAPLYFGVHGGTRRTKAAIGLKREGDYGIGSLIFALDSNGDDANVTFANDEKMRITTAGNVHLNTGVDARVQLGTSGTGASSVSDNSVYVRGNDDDLILGAAGNGNISFKENTSTHMFIKTGGNVGIGTTNPLGKFVVSNAGAGGIEFFPDSASGQNSVQHYNRSGSAYLRNRNIASEFTFNLSGASADAVTFKAGGNVGIGTTNFATTGAKLQVKGTSAAPAVSGSNFTGSIFSVEGTSTVNISMGTTGASTYDGWVQVHDAGTGTNYDLLLNPLGGKVMAGMTAPVFTNSLIQATSSTGPTIGARQTTAAQYAGGFWNNASGSTNLLGFYSGSSGSQVGSIGSPYAGELFIGGIGANSSGLLFTSGNTIQPRKNNAADNGNISIGTSGNRFKDLHLSGTAIAASFATTAGGTFTTAAGNDLNIVYPASRSLFIKEGSETHLTIDNTGRVGINRTPAQANSKLEVGGADNVSLIMAEASGATAGIGVRGGGIGLYTGTTSHFMVNTSGAATLANTLTLTDGDIVLANGHGVDFSATSAVGSSELFDDYEEGTWTPIIAHNDGSGAIPLTVVSAVYTKIGRVVTVRGYLTAINPNGNAGTSSPYYGIRGFPYAPSGYTVWHMAYASGGITSYGGYMSSANMYFNNTSGNAPNGQAHISGTQFNAWGSNLVLMFSATYNIG